MTDPTAILVLTCTGEPFFVVRQPDEDVPPREKMPSDFRIGSDNDGPEGAQLGFDRLALQHLNLKGVDLLVVEEVDIHGLARLQGHGSQVKEA
ncbi:MAG: hypothetical protein MZV64_71405 [Ignavibacteriales bacterium]|nr:hypothetical protein [Ignavibacteriales bacterium]